MILCSINVYFTKDKKIFYNKLKSIHKDNNTYSIACKLRYLIRVFIKGVELYGLDRSLLLLAKVNNKWKKKMKFKRQWGKRKNVRQLSFFPYLEALYNIDYTLIQIKLIN